MPQLKPCDHTTLRKDLKLAYAIGRPKKLRNLHRFGDSVPRFPHTLAKDLHGPMIPHAPPPDHPISSQIPRVLPVPMIGRFEKKLIPY